MLPSVRATARSRALMILRGTGVMLALVLLAAALPSLAVPVYRFPAPAPFAGAQWHNPYAGMDAALPWRTVNLHAHSAAWGGVTHGAGTPDEVRNAYRRLGYDAVAVSNYHRVDTAPGAGALAVYEHGMNVPKAHVLVLGAHRALVGLPAAAVGAPAAARAAPPAGGWRPVGTAAPGRARSP